MTATTTDHEGDLRAVHGIVDATPEHRLLAAVIHKAVVDSEASDPELAAEARLWLVSYAGDFLSVIAPAGADVETLQATLLDRLG